MPPPPPTPCAQWYVHRARPAVRVRQPSGRAGARRRGAYLEGEEAAERAHEERDSHARRRRVHAEKLCLVRIDKIPADRLRILAKFAEAAMSLAEPAYDAPPPSLLSNGVHKASDARPPLLLSNGVDKATDASANGGEWSEMVSAAHVPPHVAERKRALIAALRDALLRDLITLVGHYAGPTLLEVPIPILCRAKRTTNQRMRG